MIAAECAVLGGEGCAALIAQLFGVKFDREAERAGGVEDPTRLRGRERDRLAERIDGVDQTGCVLGGEPAADLIDVGVGSTGKFVGQRMGAQAPGLLLLGHTLALLYLAGGDALGHEQARTLARRGL